MLALAAIVADPSGGVSATQLYVVIGVLWSSLIGAIAFIRNLYEARDLIRREAIETLEKRVEKLESGGDRAFQALEQAVAISARQNDLIEGQIAKQGQALGLVIERLEEIKVTTARRPAAGGRT